MKNYSEDALKLKHGLFDLISNVILFEEENSNGQKFHFRFGIAEIQLLFNNWNITPKAPCTIYTLIIFITGRMIFGERIYEKIAAAKTKYQYAYLWRRSWNGARLCSARL